MKSFIEHGKHEQINILESTGLNYNKKYLKVESASTKGFLKSIAYNVELRQLLRIKKTCAYNQRMVYTPIVVDIVEPKLKEHYGGNFLLQVYDKDGEHDIPAWNIFFDYFVFKLDQKEKGSGWIYVVHLTMNCAVVKVKDIVPDDPSCNYFIFISLDEYFGVSQDLLYYANHKEIKIIDIALPIQPGQVLEFIPKTDQYINFPIKGPCRLMQIFETVHSRSDNYIMTAIETDDNQIDTTRLYFWNRNLRQPDLEFYQYREVVRRDHIENDPIIKFKQVIRISLKEDREEDCSFAVALRQSGMVDLYWNYTLTSSPDDPFADVDLTYNNFYLKKYIKQETLDGSMTQQEVVKKLVIALDNEQRIGPDVAEVHSYKDEKWETHFYDLIRYYVRIFTKITLVTTNFFVSYNKVVSIYDIVKKEWKFHFFFEEDVIELLRNQKNPGSSDVNVGAFLENGDIKIIDTNDIHGENWRLTDQTFNIPGKVVTLVSDWRDISSHYILTKLPSGKLQFSGFQCNKVVDLNSIAKFCGMIFCLILIENEELIRFISPDLKEDFVLLNRSEGYIRSFINQENNGVMNTIENRRFKLKDSDMITGKLHSFVASNNTEFMLLFDDKNIYNLNLEDGSIQVQENMNIQSLQVLDVDYCYSLSNESKTQSSPGFYIQNINGFIDRSVQSANFKLKGAIVGINGLLDFYQEDQRIAYMASFDTIKIVPVLHRCAIGFIGMQPRDKYLAFKKVKDQLIALDKKGYLTTWSVITGKILAHQKIQKGFELGTYEIFAQFSDDTSYKASWCQPRVLLIDRQNEVPVDESEYYGDRLKTALENNTPYIKIEKKSFLRHRVIEILNQSEIEEHFTFVHPNYGLEQYQRLYLSDDLQFMLERLQNQRVFFYKREETNIPGEIKWMLARRIKQFPMDLSECTYVNYLFSPNLQFYLDYDKDDNIFLIKNTIDQSTYKVIPQGLMNPAKEPVHAIGKKFTWLDNQKIRIMNTEGFEKTIDVTSDFKQLSYCATPNFSNQYLLDNEFCHFYYDISVTKENETMPRLRRKYQEYYSAINSDGKRSPEELYEVLFRVDYNVDNCKGKLVADMSFTFFHWKLAEMMQNQTRFNIKSYHPDELKALALNIFPGGNTVLHYAYKQLYLVRRFYKVMEQEYQKKKEAHPNNDNIKKFEIPFIQNYQGKTPIHLCLENQNLKSADIILSKLCNESIDSHSRSIQDILPQIVAAELPSVGPYLDSRIIVTQQLKDFRRGAIKFIDGKEYALGTIDMWADVEDIQMKFFTESKIDTEVVLQMIDVPAVHSYQEKVGDDFFDALANSKNIDIFNFKSIQALVDYKWPIAKEYTIKILFIPYIIYLLTFMTYSNIFNEQYSFEENPGMYQADIALSAVLYCFSVYFLQNEIKQIIMGPLEYLTSIWNYCDFVPPCFIITIVSMHLKRNTLPEIIEVSSADLPPEGEVPPVEGDLTQVFNIAGMASIHSLACLLMWFKLLYFLRIFESTGYLVRMITEVINQMRVFLLMLGIVLIAFSEAFIRLSEHSEPDFQFINNYGYGFVYSFRLAVGDTVTDVFNDTVQPALLWTIFCLHLLLTNVVMLNLLIAIISESFNDINNNAIQANYQERARIISENSYLIPKWRKKAFGGRNQYLVMAKEKTEDDHQKDPLVDIFDRLREVSNTQLKMKKEIAAQFEVVFEKLAEMKKDILHHHR